MMSSTAFESDIPTSELPEAVFLEDLAGNIVDVNEQACKLLGYEREELLELAVDDLVPEGAPAFLPGQIDKATRNGKPLETVNLSKDGTEVPVELRGKMIEVEGEERMLISIRDITKRKKKEKKQQIATEASSQAIYLFQGGKFKYVNESFEKLTGYNKEELNHIGFLKLVHPDDRERVARWNRQALAGDTSGLPERVEYKVLTKKEETMWVRTLPSLIEFEGKPAIVGNAVDITDEKELKKGLQAKENLMESVMSLTPNLIYFKDDQHRFERVNEAYTDLLGLTEEEMIGETAEDFWPEVEENREDERRALSGEPVVGKERRVTLPDGEKRWYSINKLPRRDADGKVIGLLGISRDITQRKRTEKKLHERRREMKTLLSSVPGMSYRCKKDRDWTMMFVSEGCEELTGYEPEELIDNQLVSYKDLIVEEDRERIWGVIQNQLDKNSPYELEYRIRTKSEELKWVWEQGRGIFDSNGELLNIQGFITDISERKRTELALNEEREKLKGLHAGVNELQEQDTEEAMLQTAVDVAKNILDFKICIISTLEGDYLVPKAVSPNLDTDETTTFKIGEGIAGKTVQEGETIWGNDVRNYREAKPTNEDFRAFISVPIGDMGNLQALSEKEGSFTKQDVELAEILAGHLHQELNEIKLEEELKNRAQSLEKSNEKLEDIIHIISHDLKEPLRSIGTYSDMLFTKYREDMTDTSSQRLKDIKESATRLKKMLNEVSDLAKVTADVSPEPIRVQELVEEVKSELGRDLKGVKIKVNPDFPEVKFDRFHLKVLLKNLIANGLKYNEEPKQVEVGYDLRPDNSKLEIYVQDNGKGIDEENQERVFKMFEQLGADKDSKGTGAGLAICKKIVEGVDEEIWLDSDPGVGTTVGFTVPLNRGGGNG